MTSPTNLTCAQSNGTSPDSHGVFLPNKICWQSQCQRGFSGYVR